MLTNAVNGVISDGFITIVQPVAKAGPVFQTLREEAIIAQSNEMMNSATITILLTTSV